MEETLQHLLERQGVVVLDGGLATELEARGCDLDDELWSAKILVEEPESIRRVHLDYLEAGADCIVTASYQATLEGFARRGCSDAEAVELLQRAVTLALEAREEFWASAVNRQGRCRPLVAVSVGPYGAALADGSEFTGGYDLDDEGLASFHERRWRILVAAGADLVACETLPSDREARILLGLLRRTPHLTAWFSFACRDERRLANGSSVAAIAAELSRSPQVVAVGANCTAPRYIAGLIRELRRASGVPVIVYPNSGEAWDARSKRWLPAEDSPSLASQGPYWRELGARVIGGCCRTRPADIRRLRQELLG